jgi:hypothetical protein
MKAIETMYRQYRFRSRLEARWAVFFDALGVKWQYEPEGYVLDDGTPYLPDFLTEDFIGTDQIPMPTWFEIKSTADNGNEADRRMAALVRESKVNGFLCFGDPLEGKIVFYVPNDEMSNGVTRCPIDLSRAGEETIAAARLARSARFEHGETPWPTSVSHNR